MSSIFNCVLLLSVSPRTYVRLSPSSANMSSLLTPVTVYVQSHSSPGLRPTPSEASAKLIVSELSRSCGVLLPRIGTLVRPTAVKSSYQSNVSPSTLEPTVAVTTGAPVPTTGSLSPKVSPGLTVGADESSTNVLPSS